MTAQLIGCLSDDELSCKGYCISGFVNPNNKYKSITVCDWDCCLYSAGIVDSVDIPGYGTIYPSGLPDPETQCTNCTSTTWNGLVDGHITYTYLNCCYVKVTGGAGGPIERIPIGTILHVSAVNFDAIYGSIQSDNYRYSNITNICCGNSSGSHIFFVLGDPSPDNT